MRQFFFYFIGIALALLATNLEAIDADSLRLQLDPLSVDEEQARLRLELAEEVSNTDIGAAVQYARQALSYARQLELKPLEAEARLAIGRFYDYMGVSREALDHLLEALSIFQDLGDRKNQAQTLMYIGNVYWYLKQYESAQDCYSQVSQFGEILHDTSLIISALIARGAVDGNTDRMESAKVLFQRANALAREYGTLQQQILSYYNLGDVTLYSGNADEALVIFLDLEQNFDLERNDTKHLGSLFNSMTQAYLMKGNLEKAREYSSKARKALNQYPRLTENKDYYLALFRIDTMEHRTLAALENYMRYTQLDDSLNDANFRERLANLEIYNTLKDKETEIEKLTLDNQYKDLKIRQRKTINYGSIAMVALLGVIVFLVIRNIRKIRRSNRLLEDANKKISSQSEDLKEKNAELESVIDELKATQLHLVQSEKMASLGTLTAGIAHEINNPLNFISGGLELIRGTMKEGEDRTDRALIKKRLKALQMASEGLDRAAGIVRALMTFSHKGASQLISSDLHEIIDNTLLFLNTRISSGIRVNKDYGLHSNVPVYPEKMHQVIMNILDNALYAVSKNPGNDKRITISTREEGKMAVLRIANNGPGVDEKNIHQLFDPFFTTRDPGEGTGLGLSISYTLIREHNGSIKAENLPGEVAFIIEIPL